MVQTGALPEVEFEFDVGRGEVNAAGILVAILAALLVLRFRFKPLNAAVLSPVATLLVAEAARFAFGRDYRQLTWQLYLTLLTVGVYAWLGLIVDPVFLLLVAPAPAYAVLWTLRAVPDE